LSVERIGFVGLPNSGKSSLFNALTGGSAPVASHPFSTTETSVGVAQVPDQRLDALAEMSSSKKVVHAGVELVDIAGLVAGSSTGEGLGNRFLGGIREADAICLVLRAFEDPNVPGGTDPLEDLAVLELELVLADLASAETQLERRRKAAKQDHSLDGQVAALDKALGILSDGTPLYRSGLSAEQLELLRPFFMLTNKPVLVVVNLGEEAFAGGEAEALTKPVADELAGVAEVLGVSVKLEAEAAQLSAADRAEMMEGLGLGEGALPRVARPAYLFHHRGQREQGLDVQVGRQGAGVRRRHPFRPPAWLYPCGGRALGRAAQVGLVGGRSRRRQAAGRRQGVRSSGR
jgi:GTP-binding protein YchF